MERTISVNATTETVTFVKSTEDTNVQLGQDKRFVLLIKMAAGRPAHRGSANLGCNSLTTALSQS